MVSIRSKLLIPIMVLSALFILCIMWAAYASCPTTKTAWVGTDNNGNYQISPVTWTQPSGCSGTFKIPLNVYRTGVTYGVWITNNTDGGYALSPYNFTATMDCNSGPTANLEVGHSYTMTVDEAVHQGGDPRVWAEAKIFIDCPGG